ncbi:uncharacterized protein [Phyllobates terribilis]|uniref:uncharacterized protein isoform X2 n=1 Tax=Phyllobates terribilis TaxID=111132 RepID=UPI003CCB4FE5
MLCPAASMASVDTDQQSSRPAICEESSSQASVLTMDPCRSSDHLAADDPALPDRTEDCGSPQSAVTSEVIQAAPSPHSSPPPTSSPPPRSVTPDPDSSSEGLVLTMDPCRSSDHPAADDPALPDRTEDCGSPQSAVTSEVIQAAPSPQTSPPPTSSPPPRSVTPDPDSSSEGLVLTMDPCRSSDHLAADDPALPDRTEDCGSPQSDVIVMSPLSATESAPPAGLEDGGDSGGAASSAEVSAAPGSVHTSDSGSAALAGTSRRVRSRKSCPRKREMPDDTDLPLDIIVKEESSDEENRVAVSAEPSSGADHSRSSVIWASQNGSGNPPSWSAKKSRKGRKKKRSPSFQKPLLMRSAADTASLMFVIPSEGMEAVTETKKKRKCREEQYEELHWCDTCDDCFPEEAALEEHEKTHRERPQEELDCEDCGRLFDSASELEEHRSKKHSKLRYCCDICGIQYNYKSQFIIHMRAHTGERPFSCDHCGQSFGHKCSLVIHQRKHTGVTPHQCRKCKKMLDTRKDLVKHEKMRYCPDCGKCYTSRSFAKHLVKSCIKT